MPIFHHGNSKYEIATGPARGVIYATVTDPHGQTVPLMVWMPEDLSAVDYRAFIKEVRFMKETDHTGFWEQVEKHAIEAMKEQEFLFMAFNCGCM